MIQCRRFVFQQRMHHAKIQVFIHIYYLMHDRRLSYSLILLACIQKRLATTVSSSSTFTSTTSRTGASTSGGTSSTSSGVTSGPFNCPDSFGVYPVPGVPCSNQFWKCSNGYAYLMVITNHYVFFKDLF